MLICISLIISNLSVFSCACWPPVCLLWRNFYLGLLPIFFFAFFYFKLYKLFVYFENSSLLIALFANIFIPVCILYFCFVYGFLCCAKVLNLIRSHLFIFVFIPVTLGDRPKEKYCCSLCQRVLCLCFPLEVLEYLVLHLHLHIFSLESPERIKPDGVLTLALKIHFRH